MAAVTPSRSATVAGFESGHSYDGGDMAAEQCARCGATLFAGDRFCEECGQPLRRPPIAAAAPAPVAAPTAPAALDAAPVYEPVYAPGSEPVPVVVPIVSDAAPGEQEEQLLHVDEALDAIHLEGNLGDAELVVVSTAVPADNVDTMRQMSDWFRDKLGSSVVAVGAVIDEKPLVVAAVTDDVQKRGMHAGNLVRDVAALARLMAHRHAPARHVLKV